MRIETFDLDSPVGVLRLALREARLCGLAFEDRWDGLERFLERRFGAVELAPAASGGDAGALVAAYFDGELESLDRITVDPGGSGFQREVWETLRRIPAGRTTSYTDLAHAIGRASAARAVATANATNPVAIVIPCHRVIHADGSVSGYGGGVERKRWLLRHEARARPFHLSAPEPMLSSGALKEIP